MYRATDTKLKRQVAIKLLPASVAQDSERLARFQREAEVLAQLNQPNIAAIHGLEEADGLKALVMELVEGPTLADRIAQGSFPVDEALPIARQIVEALEAAHERGIVHRDLKPANIKVREDGTVKVLDFGLAKALEPTAAAVNASQSPTITSPAMTQAGMILGTAAYMAPEQARGRAIDRRADIWAFGCVLYEMLTARRAFDDDNVSMTISKVLLSEPDLDALPSTVPARVRQVIRVCLQKDPKRRAQAIGDVQLALEGAFNGGDSSGAEPAVAARLPFWRRPLSLAAAASLLTAAVVGPAVGVAIRRTLPSEDRPVARFEHELPAGETLRSTSRPVFALSKDGRYFVFNGSRGLYLRALDSFEDRLLPGTLGQTGSLTSPFFSPDGRFVGYWQDEQLKRMAVTGGAPVVIGPAENPFGVSWESDGTIFFGGSKGIMRVPATGGTPQLVIVARPGEQLHGPQLLPDDSVLFTATTATGVLRWDSAQVAVQSLRSGERTVVLEGASDARYLPTGHLVYALGANLFAIPFDADRRVVRGEAASVVQGVERAGAPAANTATANYGVSDAGTMAYLKSTAASQLGLLTWVTRDGKETTLSPAVLDRPRNPRVSPDGARVAVIVADDVWVYEAAGRPPIKIASDLTAYSPLWTPDGRQIVFEAAGRRPAALLIAEADAGSSAPRPVSSDGHFHPLGWLAGGRELVAARLGPNDDIVRWPLATPSAVQPLIDTPAQEGFRGGAVSPDGRWLAYASNQTGEQEIWVRPIANAAAAMRVSPNGGVEPVWARSGRELFYLEGGRLMGMAVTAGESFSFSPPKPLFAFESLVSTQPPSYDVAPDGRFLLLRAAQGSGAVQPPRIAIVQNWTEELKRLWPAK